MTIYQCVMPKQEENLVPDSSKPFNPLSKAQLARSLAEAFLTSELHPLPPGTRFSGEGVYAIYYTGGLSIYRALIKRNAVSKDAAPIYVGKAIPSGGRKGGMDFEAAPGHSLFNRLTEHGVSVAETSNLESRDFLCRYLVVDDVWIPLAESLLIERFQPLWNVLVDGFGNHDPGSGRHQQKKSPWDVLHPGRGWADRLQPCAKSKEEVEAEIAAFFQNNRGR
jgi:hypothetical protein